MDFPPVMLLQIPVFLFSLTFHEFSHAWSARLSGDMTATHRGRHTMNPLAHIDPVGTVLLPLLAMFSHVPVIGWAKPVPIDERNFRRSISVVWVSIAGPLSNFTLVVLFTAILKLMVLAGGKSAAIAGYYAYAGVSRTPGTLSGYLALVCIMFIIINTVLAIFNLLPIPPLDGSHIVHYFLIRRNPDWMAAWDQVSRYGFLLLWLAIMYGPTRDFLTGLYSTPLNAILDWILV